MFAFFGLFDRCIDRDDTFFRCGFDVKDVNGMYGLGSVTSS